MLVVKTRPVERRFRRRASELIPASGFKANLCEDTGEVLGVLSDEYEVYLQ